MGTVSQVLRYDAPTGAQPGQVYIDAGMATADIVGRGYWRDGQTPAAFLLTIVDIYTQRTGHAPALAICAPGQVAELVGHGVEVRAARVNARLVILAGVADATP